MTGEVPNQETVQQQGVKQTSTMEGRPIEETFRYEKARKSTSQNVFKKLEDSGGYNTGQNRNY